MSTRYLGRFQTDPFVPRVGRHGLGGDPYSLSGRDSPKRRMPSAITGSLRPTMCWASMSRAAPAGRSRALARPTLSRPVCTVRLPRRLHQYRRFLDAGLDPGAAADRARRETGRLSRRLPVRARGIVPGYLRCFWRCRPGIHRLFDRLGTSGRFAIAVGASVFGE